MKRIFMSVTAATLCLTGAGLTSLPSAQAAQVQNFEYSGEDIFKGFVFGQGEIGKNLSSVFSKSALKELDKKEMKEFANLVEKRINEKDPGFFKELQKATYGKDPQKVDELLNKAGKIIKDDLSNATDKLKEMEQAAQRAGYETQNETYLYYYYVAAAGAVVTIILLAIDFTPIVAADDFNREAAIGSLLEEVN
ncbi:sporulation delaying protein family toxin [Bacillus thuringiensis]|nr:sporulation delaying protein family toxin [Bacillus thuringiensis]